MCVFLFLCSGCCHVKFFTKWNARGMQVTAGLAKSLHTKWLLRTSLFNQYLKQNMSMH